MIKPDNETDSTPSEIIISKTKNNSLVDLKCNSRYKVIIADIPIMCFLPEQSDRKILENEINRDYNNQKRKSNN